MCSFLVPKKEVGRTDWTTRFIGGGGQEEDDLQDPAHHVQLTEALTVEFFLTEYCIRYCMEYLEDYECDRTEEIIRYTWNTSRYAKRKVIKGCQKWAQERGAGPD